jgi:RLL motif-containing protein 1
MVLGARSRALAVEALGYVKPLPPLDVNDVAFRRCVAWLEDTKIRATPMDSRGPLRDVAADSWPEALAALARETGFELDASAPGASTRAFDHLLERAVALDYRDHADDLGEVVRDLKNAAIGDRPREAKRQKVEVLAPGFRAAEDPRHLDEPPRWTDLDAPETRRCLRELGEALAVDPETVARGSAPDADAEAFDALADACARKAERLVAPFWSRVIAAEEATTTASASPASPASPGRGAPWGLVPGDFPPGIELGGPGGSSPLVVAAAETLRVMHVNDLRELQSAVDALLVQMQEYTGDPRTDAALGRVGEG